MTDWVGHAPKNHMTSLEQWERSGGRQCHDTQLLCHKRFIWLHPHFYGSSGRSRIDFVTTPLSVQFSRIFVNFTAGRRLQLIPAAGPRDHMPLTMDLVTNGMRHSPDPMRGRWDHEKIEEMLSDPVARITFFKELETIIRNSSIVGLAARQATPGDAWENLVQIIQGTAAPCLHLGAPRPTRPLSLERRRLPLELGTARRLTGSSGDQSLVDTAKTEITRVQKQMRRFSRWLLRRRRAMWLEELEEGIRKQDAFTVYRYARLLAGTGIGSKHCRLGQIRAYTPSQAEWAQGLATEGPKGGLAPHEYTWTDFRREHLELLDPADSETTVTHRKEARDDYNRTLKQLRRAPARRSCPPWSIPGRLLLLLMWPTFLAQKKPKDALGYKPPAGSELTETRHDIIACMESTRRCESAPVVSSRSMVWVFTKRVMSFGTWDVRFLESVAPWSFSGGNVARITVVLLWIPMSTSEGGSSGFAPGTGSTLSTREHLIC